MMAIIVFFYSQTIYKVAYDWVNIALCLAFVGGIVFVNYRFAGNFSLYGQLAFRFGLSVTLMLGLFGLFFRSKSESARMKQILQLLKNRKKKNE
jgi:FtsH-binding integral membrane protein